MTPVSVPRHVNGGNRRAAMIVSGGGVSGTLVLRRASWATVNGPIALAISYLAATIALYAFGPWPFPVSNPLRFYGFLVAANLALLIGFLLGTRHAVQHPRVCANRWSPELIVRIGAIVTLILLVPTWLLRVGFDPPDFYDVIASPGEAYQRSQEARASGTPTVEYLRMLAAPFTVAVAPLLIAYWHGIRRATRVLGILALGSTITLFVFMGTNKAIADLLMVIPIALVIGHVSGSTRLPRRAMVAGAGLLLIGFVAFGSFFAAGQATRQGSASFFGYFSVLDVTADRNHPLVEPLPPLGQVGVLGLTLYTTTGYVALDLALREPFVPCYGVGNSFFLSRQAARLTGESYFESCSYPARIEVKYGWNNRGLWSSAYTWFASDLTFSGTIVLMAVIGFTFGLSWVEALRGVTPYAVVTAALLALMIVYLPGNNQMMQHGESLAGFVGCLALWRWSPRRRGVARLIPIDVSA